ncbi:hypothetical protein ABZ942_18730 [Nocardia sp. NPDC046473]|uniref:hypothetical protein n=1 Tax=Nocardia sp. NPDC046473 TaxID=3155733 RepID=UPI0033F85832
MPENETDTNVPESWAEPGTLLGMMQRGRGACYREARAEPVAAGNLVVECIVHDPRWDHQVEQRSWLYAMLVADSGIELSRLRAAYSGPVDPHGDSDAWLATGVLERLARRGVNGAVTELRHYLRSGRDLDQALDRLIPFVEHPEAEGLLNDVLEIADDEQLASTLAPFGQLRDLSAPPWPNWRRASARMERIIVAAAHIQGSGERRVLDRAAREAANRERVLRAAVEANLVTAVSEVTEARWETTLLRIAPNLLQDKETPLVLQNAVRKALRTLRSPQALTWARTCATLDDSVGRSALSLFAELSETSDAPRVFEFLTEAVSGGNTHLYDQNDLVSALGRLNHVAARAAIDEIFDNTIYSYLRIQCATALGRLAPDFADERAVECLDDCEPETRELGIAHANIAIPAVRERIGRTADDPTEEACNRRAATDRIMQRR